jgi:ribosome biogenesis GTPase
MMSERRHKTRRQKDVTSSYLSGDLDEDRLESEQRFTQRSKGAQQDKMEKTALLRAAEGSDAADIETLPIGQVIQVYSQFCNVEHPDGIRLCVTRKTLGKLSDSSIVVGDLVRFRDTDVRDESGLLQAVIEQVLPRKTILTRAGSFRTHAPQPIVANAQQMLIVASLVQPRVKWGLVDRMLIAAQSGGLVPVICLNKIDLAQADDESARQLEPAQTALAHYASMGISTLQTGAKSGAGMEQLKGMLAGQTTVLAGHSGVGKSTLISAIQPELDIRVGVVSVVTEKGRHTTTSARRYPLDIGGYVIDTPGVKVFGLWGVTADNLLNYFPDVVDETAPKWRIESYRRIAAPLSRG